MSLNTASTRRQSGGAVGVSRGDSWCLLVFRGAVLMISGFKVYRGLGFRGLGFRGLGFGV